MRYRKHKGSKAKTTRSRSRSSRPTRFGYGMTGISIVTILAMQAVKSDMVVSDDTVAEDTTISVSEDTVEDTVADVVEDTVADVVEDTVNLGSMTKAQLLEHAEKVGIKVYKSWTKTKMIETLSV
tara:strand:- start:44 stop:418 length:375 start_codon:yes stop_codon:yes gene_type:complete